MFSPHQRRGTTSDSSRLPSSHPDFRESLHETDGIYAPHPAASDPHEPYPAPQPQPYAARVAVPASGFPRSGHGVPDSRHGAATSVFGDDDLDADLPRSRRDVRGGGASALRPHMTRPVIGLIAVSVLSAIAVSGWLWTRSGPAPVPPVQASVDPSLTALGAAPVQVAPNPAQQPAAAVTAPAAPAPAPAAGQPTPEQVAAAAAAAALAAIRQQSQMAPAVQPQQPARPAAAPARQPVKPAPAPPPVRAQPAPAPVRAQPAPAYVPTTPASSSATIAPAPAPGPGANAASSGDSGGKLVMATAKQLRIRGITPQGVVLETGRLVKPGDKFDNGEILKGSDPETATITTDKRRYGVL